ncbi:hypothetical protein GGD83_004008 [Rhodoblastus sphagnicola]|nr:hypothetical protein [Rhodoblastus sphagnicola]
MGRRRHQLSQSVRAGSPLTAHTVAQEAYPEAYRDFTAKMSKQPDEDLGYVKIANDHGAGTERID